MASSCDGLTRDAFLGGRVMALAAGAGYRAGVDAVMLAAAVPRRPGEAVLDLGCGVGAAALALSARVPGLRLTGVELQPEYADLARRNGLENNADFCVFTADVAHLPDPVRGALFHHVMINPPYFRRDGDRGAVDPGRETAFAEALPLADWIAAGTRRLRSGGWLTLIHRAARLADILAALDTRMGSVRIRPLAPRAGRPALGVIVQARKGGRAPLSLMAPLVLHAGDRHPGDIDHFTAQAAAILKSGGALPMHEPAGAPGPPIS